MTLRSPSPLVARSASPGVRCRSASPAPALPGAPLWSMQDARPQVLPLPSPLTTITLYTPDRSDPIDVALANGLAVLANEARTSLPVKRIGLGKYEIDRRIVTLSWGSKGLLVREDNCNTAEKPVPLLQYLFQAANVARSLKDLACNANRDFRVTFDMENVPGETDRREAMRIACKQAGIRKDYRRSHKNGSGSPGRRVRVRLSKKAGSEAGVSTNSTVRTTGIAPPALSVSPTRSPSLPAQFPINANGTRSPNQPPPNITAPPGAASPAASVGASPMPSSWIVTAAAAGGVVPGPASWPAVSAPNVLPNANTAGTAMLASAQARPP